MTITTLSEHPSYCEAYYLLNEIVSAKDAGLSGDALSLLSEAALELTDYGADAPSQALLPIDLQGLDHPSDGPSDGRSDERGAALEASMRRLDELLSRLLLDTSGLQLGLRITRVRDLVSQVRRQTRLSA